MITATDDKVVSINSVEHIDGYLLQITFDDGKVSRVDFGPFLKSSKHPDIRSYLNLDKFSQFKISDGVLHWNDYDLIFPMEDLYDGVIKK